LRQNNERFILWHFQGRIKKISGGELLVKLIRFHGELHGAKTAVVTSCIYTRHQRTHRNHELQPSYLHEFWTDSPKNWSAELAAMTSIKRRGLHAQWSPQNLPP
jgi:hypothetical protein